MQQNDIDIFEDFIGKNVKVIYMDVKAYKVARGRLVDYNDKFVKIQGSLGTIMINVNKIEKITEIN